MPLHPEVINLTVSLLHLQVAATLAISLPSIATITGDRDISSTILNSEVTNSATSFLPINIIGSNISNYSSDSDTSLVESEEDIDVYKQQYIKEANNIN